MPPVDDMALAIEARFYEDIERMLNDMKNIQVWTFDDFTIAEARIDMSAEEIQYRMSMAVDSAAWQGYELGRVEIIDARGQKFKWVLDPGAQHCADCIAYAASGPYTLEELPGIPGDAPTDCNGGCRCDLIEVAA